MRTHGRSIYYVTPSLFSLAPHPLDLISFPFPHLPSIPPPLSHRRSHLHRRFPSLSLPPSRRPVRLAAGAAHRPERWRADPGGGACRLERRPADSGGGAARRPGSHACRGRTARRGVGPAAERGGAAEARMAARTGSSTARRGSCWRRPQGSDQSRVPWTGRKCNRTTTTSSFASPCRME